LQVAGLKVEGYFYCNRFAWSVKYDQFLTFARLKIAAQFRRRAWSHYEIKSPPWGGGLWLNTGGAF
jgi:hypothetical protein